MSSTEAQIEAKSAELSNLRNEAQTPIKAFILATEEAIRTQAMPISRAIGREQTKASEALGAEGIQSLVSKVSAYIEGLPQLCQQAIYQKSAWNLIEGSENTSYTSHRESESYGGVDLSVRYVAPHVADVLKPLIDILEGSGFDTRELRFIPNFKYKQPFQWSEGMKAECKAYYGISTKYWETEQAIRALQAKLEKENVDKLWDAHS